MAKAEKLLDRMQPATSTTRPTWRCCTTCTRGCARTRCTSATCEYVVKDGQVVIVDEFTGRLMPGRRWSDGLHQAVEAKEGVKIERENQTLATITFQNYFRMYKKLSGMTGTAETEAPEFDKIYKLDVVVIPTNRPLIRVEDPDVVYRTAREKFDAVVDEIIELQRAGPAGPGRHDLDREVRDALGAAEEARHQARRAERQVPRARGRDRRPGRPPGPVTIATNMAGRGTDILLGGNPEHMARQQCLAEQVAEKLPNAARRSFVDDDEFVYFFHIDGFYRVPRPDWERIYGHFKQQCDAEHDEVVAPRRPAHPRHRAPRGAPHRQPAARPRRPPGRPRLARASTCRSRTT